MDQWMEDSETTEPLWSCHQRTNRKRKKTKCVKLDDRIKITVQRYQVTGDIMCRLKALAYIKMDQILPKK